MVDETKFINKKKRFNLKSALLLLLPIALMAAGLYLLFLTQAPRINLLKPDKPTATKIGENRVLAKEANIDEYIYEGEGALEKGAWHRYPERGNPVEGGNFIISAHRFVFDVNPGAANEKSRFYNIEELTEGDEITVHWEGSEYKYEVTRKYEVEPTAVEIEDKTKKHVLTMYSCTLGGRYDGRVVIRAKPMFKI